MRSTGLATRASDRRLGLLAMVAGLGLALGAQVAQPVGVPLYDGVVVEEPYRYLNPVGDQTGSPSDFSLNLAVTGGISPRFSAATAESPPQAQLVAQTGAFELLRSDGVLQISIAPIAPPATVPAGRRIVGNAYSFSVADEAGTELRPKPCPGCLSIHLRAPVDAGPASLMRFEAGAWVDVATNSGNIAGGYGANPSALGDYAVVEIIEAGVDIRTLVLGGAAGFIVLVAAAYVYTHRNAEPAAVGPPRGVQRARRDGVRPARIPSKRKRSGGPRKGSSAP